jgi:hypothetical protein
MILRSPSVQQLTRANIWSDIEQYGASIYVSPYALAPKSQAMLQQQMSTGAKLIRLVQDAELFRESEIVRHLDEMSTVKAYPNQFVLLVHDAVDKINHYDELLIAWNEKGGASYFVPSTVDLFLWLTKIERQIDARPYDIRQTLLSLPHVTNEIAERLCEFGAQAFQLLTIRRGSLEGLTGLTEQQIQDIRSYLELPDDYELIPSRIEEPTERIIMETSEI